MRYEHFAMALRSIVPIALAVALLGNSASQAQNVPAGVDCWRTGPGSTLNLPTLPADFFGPGSNPFPSQALAVGPGSLVSCDCQSDFLFSWTGPYVNPLEPNDSLLLDQVFSSPDICIKRLLAVIFPGGIGVADPIDIELVSLSLKSVDPITVDFGGFTRQFDVFVTDSGSQGMGTLDPIPTQFSPILEGDLDRTDLPINYRIDFEEVGGPGFQTLPNLGLTFANSDGTFSRAPLVPALPTLSVAALLLALLGAGALAMRRGRLS